MGEFTRAQKNKILHPVKLLFGTFADITEINIAFPRVYGERPTVDYSADLGRKLHLDTPPLPAYILGNCSSRNPEPPCGFALG